MEPHCQLRTWYPSHESDDNYSDEPNDDCSNYHHDDSNNDDSNNGATNGANSRPTHLPVAFWFGHFLRGFRNRQ